MIFNSRIKENMRNLQLEAAIWNLFTSTAFFEAAAEECEETMEWFGTLAVHRQVANFGRNNQIYDKYKSLARDFRRGAEFARLEDYELIWTTARSVRGDVRGMMEQPLQSWMTESEFQEFESTRINAIMTYGGRIDSALNNALIGATSFLTPNPNCPEQHNHDYGYPGEEIVDWYNDYVEYFNKPLICTLADPLPQYTIDTGITCRTGDEVPWTGVWYPSTGLEQHSLTFAVKGQRMQAAYRVSKTIEELESQGEIFSMPETLAVATTWHPVIQVSGQPTTDGELWAKAGEACPKTGTWQPTDPGALARTYEAGERMDHLKSAHGLTVWRWVADR